MDFTSELAIFVSGVASLIIASVFAVMAFLYFKLIYKYYSLKSEKDYAALKQSQGEEARQKANKVLEEAGLKAQKIIEEATKKSQDLINQTQLLTDQQRANIQSQIELIIGKQQESFEQIFGDLKLKYSQLATSSEDLFEEGIKKELLLVKEELGSQINKFQDSLLDQIDAQQKTIESELKGYKAKRIEDIEKNIQDILIQVVKEVLGKSISASEHEDLIIEALEKAKKENIFSD